MDLQAVGGAPLIPTTLTFRASRPTEWVAHIFMLASLVHIVCLDPVGRETTIVAHVHGHRSSWLISSRGPFILNELDVPLELLGTKFLFKVVLSTLRSLDDPIEKSPWRRPSFREPTH